MSYSPAESIVRGAWQLTPDHLRTAELKDALHPILDAVAVGFRSFDCADIYPGVEALLGQARARAQRDGISLRIHTKCVPDRDRLPEVSRAEIRGIVERSLQRLGSEALDLVQFHWWDYGVPRYLDALAVLFEMKREGKIRDVGLTNFDSRHLSEILDAGFPIASLQLQYSLIDRRPESEVLPFCARHGIKVMSYGGLLGGFLRDEWLGKPDPSLETLSNRSLVKYRLIIDEWGGWERFQLLLAQLHEIALAHDASIAQVAIAAILARRRVDQVIVGISAHGYRRQNAELARALALQPDELERLWSWQCPIPGGVYELERTSDKHARIMKYDLNRLAAPATAAVAT
ncbi:MAG TPA: aldo/keto reductase [Polyangiaceae bacterium]|nr:aldo/keto reductase [Polyangiaceae bacterium]